jgi:hypothetical protein
MEFDYIVSLFEIMRPLRHKYPAIKRQINWLQSTKTNFEEINIDKEIDGMRKFLLANPDISKGELKKEIYRGGCKENIDMQNILHLGEKSDVTKLLIEKFKEIELLFFPKGRPSASSEASQPDSFFPSEFLGSEETQRIVKNDPFLSEMFSKIAKSDSFDPRNLDSMNIDEMMNNPQFLNLVSELSESLKNGQFSKDDLTNTLNSISQMMKGIDNPYVSTMVDTLKTTMADIKNGKQPNLNALQGIFSKMQNDTSSVSDISSMLTARIANDFKK